MYDETIFPNLQSLLKLHLLPPALGEEMGRDSRIRRIRFPARKGLEWEWWDLNRIRQYIQDGGLNDEQILEPVWEFEFGEEFLVLVIEYVNGPENQEAYFHRMFKVRMN
jgi:hypothetical protein